MNKNFNRKRTWRNSGYSGVETNDKNDMENYIHLSIY